MFQFLIGTLKTRVLPQDLPLQCKVFQFLIGTLKTRPRSKSVEAGDVVSIPHRYAKNKREQTKKTKSGIVSIPHRYAKNGRMG